MLETLIVIVVVALVIYGLTMPLVHGVLGARRFKKGKLLPEPWYRYVSVWNAGIFGLAVRSVHLTKWGARMAAWIRRDVSAESLDYVLAENARREEDFGYGSGYRFDRALLPRIPLRHDD